MKNNGLLELNGVFKSFGGVEAVRDVDLSVQEGEIRAIIGPNGAGKTTLMHVISKFLQPDRGTIVFEGNDLSDLEPYELPFLGLVRTFQIATVCQELTLRQNVQAALVRRRGQAYRFFKPAREYYLEEALALLERVGLVDQAESLAGYLAYADQKRLELAVGLASEPRMFMLDEPMGGMAAGERESLSRLIEEVVREENVTVVFTEHDMEVVFALAHRISVMNQGQILAEGEPGEIRANEDVQRVYLGENL